MCLLLLLVLLVRCRRVRSSHRARCHPLQILLLQVGYPGNRKVKVVGPRTLHPGTMGRMRCLRRRAEGRVERRDHRARRSEVRLAKMMPRMAQVRRIHQHRVLMMRVVLRHGWVVRVVTPGVRFRSVMEAARRPSGVVERRLVLVMVRGRPVSVLLLGLLARMRLLGRVVDIVVPDAIVARQRASDAWVPPERAALDGRRRLDRKNLVW